MEQPKYDVFISYSRKDTAIANKVISAFDNAGITYFIDKKGIGGGMEFPAVLAKAIRESRVFLFLASKNSYESKFTQSEIVYAFNKKQKQDIIPYIIDGSKMPDELEFTFSSINWRHIEEHPIDTILVDDILLKIGKNGKANEKTEILAHNPTETSQKGIIKSFSWLKKFNFTGKHLAIIALSIAIAFLLWAIIVSKSFVHNHFNTIENVMIPVLLVFLLMTIIGYIRPASICLPNRKDVSKFYLSSFLIMFIAFGITDSKTPAHDKSTETIEQQDTHQQTEE